MDECRNQIPEKQQSADQALLNAKGLEKVYGQTIAVKAFDISIMKGEVIGLLGGNGAGKSTLTRIISGVTVPDAGEMVFNGRKIEFGQFNPSMANSLGIRVVYQELSLCTNLSVYENFYIELSSMFKGNRKWRKSAADIAKAMLNDVFPGNDIDVDARLDSLTITQMQMVEIARAFCDPKLKLLILDEPTSSLPVEQTEQLKSYVRKKAKDGISFIFITHRLKEAITLVDRIYVAQSGARKWVGLVEETSETDLIAQMGGNIRKASEEIEENTVCGTTAQRKSHADIFITADKLHLGKGESISFHMQGGEIIGLAGLEGSGQRELLHRIFSHRTKGDHTIKLNGKIAYVTGDRKKEGNLSLWSVLNNMMITKLVFGKLRDFISEKSLLGSAQHWHNKLEIKSESINTNITDLSGGNQQKVLIARAMVADADIIILDDPMRGVDMATKHQLYELFNEAACQGKLVFWYSSDDAEFEICTRVLVMRYHTIVAELNAGDLSKTSIVESSFRGEELNSIESTSVKAETKQHMAARKAYNSSMMVPLVAMVLVFVLCGLRSPRVFSMFGVELLLSGAAPLIFLTLGQMFIIGFSQIDLSIGYFMGLINVISATVLSTNPGLGFFVLVALLAVYACMGLVIYYCKIPAIVMTMGASFIWRGAAITILPAPGGIAPQWLTTVFWSDYVVPPVLIILIILTIVTLLFYRCKYGTVMKGFGNNPASMVRSGWSEPLVYYCTYLISGTLALLGGLMMSGISGAADANAAGPYTMLTITSVVMGGGYLAGGLVTVPGAVFGAITFSLIFSLLGFLNISTELTAAVQGFMLIVILSLRLFKKGGKRI